MTATPNRLGPNDRAPCPSSSAVRRHLARAEECQVCGTEGRRTRRDRN